MVKMYLKIKKLYETEKSQKTNNTPKIEILDTHTQIFSDEAFFFHIASPFNLRHPHILMFLKPTTNKESNNGHKISRFYIYTDKSLVSQTQKSSN